MLYMLNDTLTLLMIMHVGMTFSPMEDAFMSRAFDGNLARDD